MEAGYLNNDTIAAISTGTNVRSAIGIVRITGARCLEAVAQITSLGSLESLRANHLVRCQVIDQNQRPLDDAMLVLMRAPKSFTGEDVVELHCHGNPLLLRSVLKSLFATGLVRQAQPGEFSFRAFQNGKLRLDQVEAVADLIESSSPIAMRSAVSALDQKKISAVDNLKEKLKQLLAQVELEIDFSDQDVSTVSIDQLVAKLNDWLMESKLLQQNYYRSEPLLDGIRTVFLGAPNAGKSTLFNLLVGEDRSIVSDEQGTTRDIVREQVVVDDLVFVLSDTAGIRQAPGRIEQEGIRRSFGAWSEAHLGIMLLDASDTQQLEAAYVSDFIARLIKENPQGRIVIAVNKLDLLAGDRDTCLKELEKAIPKHGNNKISVCGLSAVEPSGINPLLDEVRSVFHSNSLEVESLGLRKQRHAQCLAAADLSVQAVVDMLKRGDDTFDLFAEELRMALDKVGEISGNVGTDELLNYIFGEFCIGK